MQLGIVHDFKLLHQEITVIQGKSQPIVLQLRKKLVAPSLSKFISVVDGIRPLRQIIDSKQAVRRKLIELILNILQHLDLETDIRGIKQNEIINNQ